MRFLTRNEKIDLEYKLKKTKDLSEWKRLFAIISYDDGELVDDIALALRIAVSTVETYLREYDNKTKTKNDPRGGGSSKLSPEESEILEKHLIEKTYLKVKNIVSFVAKEFGKSFSRSGMNAWLKDHGFTYKQPEKIPGKIDPEAQKKFIEVYEILKKSLQADEELYFVDAVHPEHQSQTVCGWVKKGEAKTLQTTGKQLRLHFSGALSLSSMKLVVQEYDTVDADAIIHFFKILESSSTAAKIHIILDNARAHKNKKLDDYLKDSKIYLHYLPPYSPNLNPIERLWKIMRECVCYNRYYPTCNDFFDAVRGFFSEKIPLMLEGLRCTINDNFQTIKPNPINLAY